ncbi:MAG: HAD family phosphatase [Alistipes sp.]|nr:HAD family phosphatase [Alistipes sp.]
MIKGLIFDMDGTLVQNMPYHLKAFNETARRHGFKIVEPVTSRFFGMRNNDIMPQVFAPGSLDGYDLDQLSDEKEAIYRELYAGNVRLTEGLDALLDDAVQCGIKCAIGSAGSIENIEFITREGGITDRIDVIVCNTDVVNCKPDPEIFIKCCERLGFDPSECVVFEDAVGGVQAAVAAGCPCVALTSTLDAEALSGAGANLVVNDFKGINIARLQELFG